MSKSRTIPTGWHSPSTGGTGGVTSVDGRTGVVTLGDKYVDVTGDVMTGTLRVGTPATGLAAAVDLGVTGLYRSPSNWSNLVVLSNDAATVDRGGSIALGGVYNAAGGVSAFGRIGAGKHNSVDGEYGGHLTLSTRPTGGTMTERIRIAQDGIVGISNSLAIGTNPASTGAIRLANGGSIYGKNTAAADVPMLRASADTITLASGASLVQIGADAALGGVQFVINGVTQVEVGGTTGNRIGLTATHKVGFYGATPVARPASTPAAATDPATTMALVNDLRTKLITLGLIA